MQSLIIQQRISALGSNILMRMKVYYMVCVLIHPYLTQGGKTSNLVVWGLNLGFVCSAQKCNLQQRACEITSVGCRLTRVQVQRPHRAGDIFRRQQRQQAYRRKHNPICARSVSLSSLLPPAVPLHSYHAWFKTATYENQLNSSLPAFTQGMD